MDKLRTHSFEVEAKVIGNSSSGWVAPSVIVASVALAFGLADVRQSFAGCGGYCEAQRARATCHQAVEAQGLQARARDAQFDKCKADPASYLQLEEITDAVNPTNE
jgi:hypothetical protein